MENTGENLDANSVLIPISKDAASRDVLIKTCYWFNRDFECRIEESDGKHFAVTLIPKADRHAGLDVRASFLSMAADFALRERIETQTKGIRELLLAKAFSEAGILEDSPEGVFGDRIEEENSNGIFKILSNA